MSRKVLLIEPNYKNKYPPMGLMKIATYFRKCGDDVRFFKGDLKVFAARLLGEEFFAEINDKDLGRYFPKFVEFIRMGKYSVLDTIPNFRGSDAENLLQNFRKRFKDKEYPRFDFVGVTTLFTFYWSQTIDTINEAKLFCKPDGQMMVGGIAATILPQYVYNETGVHPKVGLLDHAGDIDQGNTDIIDELPLDYSILEEIDYVYPAHDAYFGYMTRGCIRHCAFCAVSRLEPNYKNYISIKNQMAFIDNRFGPQKDLLLMDNNVFASECFDQIIDEIKACGFQRGATYFPASEYDIAVKNLKEGYNPRAYIRKVIKMYDKIALKLSEEEVGDFYLERKKRYLLYEITADAKSIVEFDPIFRPLYDKYVKHGRRTRFIDFNQGVDARLVNETNMKKLAEINIRPLRIAFDHYEQKDIYIKAVRIAAKFGITNLSNYLLYNFKDEPDHLYYRMKINVDLCEELGVTIYSFPMKYHPIDDPNFFRNRDYIGEHWNRKFIRAIQAVLNATKGKIGKGKEFFEEAFGKDVEEFHEILWMPETFIIYRMKYKGNLTAEWKDKFKALSPKQLEVAKKIIAKNDFSEEALSITSSKKVLEVLKYYQVPRE